MQISTISQVFKLPLSISYLAKVKIFFVSHSSIAVLIDSLSLLKFTLLLLAPTSIHGGLWLKNGTTHLICQNLLTQSYKKFKFEPLELTLPTIYFTVFVSET